MYAFLRGRALTSDTLLVGDVGYRVTTATGLPVGQDVELWIHTAVREDDISLYGFSSTGERALFNALTKVSGIGPAAAMKVLSLGSAVVAAALRDKDAPALTKAPGIGPKAAQSILLSVKVPAALLEELAGQPAAPDPLASVYDALANLGFDSAVARAAVATVVEQHPDDPVPVILRRAIASLGSRAA